MSVATELALRLAHGFVSTWDNWVERDEEAGDNRLRALADKSEEIESSDCDESIKAMFRPMRGKYAQTLDDEIALNPKDLTMDEAIEPMRKFLAIVEP